MKLKLLFTKELTSKPNFKNIEYDCVPYISISIINKSKIEKQTPKEIKNFIVTSQNGAKAIKDIALIGNFYVVGEKTATILKSQEKNVVFIAHSAYELANGLKKISTQKFIYFSGNLRRDELFDELKNFQHNIQEVKVYNTQLTPFKILKKYAGIIFFSPSAVQSFFKMNVISNETLIFALGKTTAKEVQKWGNFIIKIPKTPNEKVMIDLIQKEIDDKK